MRRGVCTLATFVHRLILKPATVKEIKVWHRIDKNVAAAVSRRLYDLGVLHIAAYRRETPSGPPSRVYAGGPGVDVPLPINKNGKPSRAVIVGRPRVRREYVAFVALWRALEEPCTVHELCEASGMYPTSIYSFIEHCMRIGAIGVAEWDRHAQMPVARYQRGVRSVPRPKRLTDKERATRTYRDRRAREFTLKVLGALSANSDDFHLAQGAA